MATAAAFAVPARWSSAAATRLRLTSRIYTPYGDGEGVHGLIVRSSVALIRSRPEGPSALAAMCMPLRRRLAAGAPTARSRAHVRRHRGAAAAGARRRRRRARRRRLAGAPDGSFLGELTENTGSDGRVLRADPRGGRCVRRLHGLFGEHREGEGGGREATARGPHPRQLRQGRPMEDHREISEGPQSNVPSKEPITHHRQQHDRVDRVRLERGDEGRRLHGWPPIR